MKQFEMIFKGDQTTEKDWSVFLTMNGTADCETIGRMLAEFAASEFRNGQAQPLRMLIAAIETLRRVVPGMEKTKGGIIKPFFN